MLPTRRESRVFPKMGWPGSPPPSRPSRRAACGGGDARGDTEGASAAKAQREVSRRTCASTGRRKQAPPPQKRKGGAADRKPHTLRRRISRRAIHTKDVSQYSYLIVVHCHGSMVSIQLALRRARPAPMVFQCTRLLLASPSVRSGARRHGTVSRIASRA